MEPIDINQLSGYYKEDLPGDSLLHKANELSVFLENNLSSYTQLRDKFNQINNQINNLPFLPLPTNEPSSNTFIYSPSNNVSNLVWKKYILPEPTSGQLHYYLQVIDNNGRLGWTSVNVLPAESSTTNGKVLMSNGAPGSASWSSSLQDQIDEILELIKDIGDTLDDNV